MLEKGSKNVCIVGYMKMDCRWIFGSSWQKYKSIMTMFLKCKHSYIKIYPNHEKFECSKFITLSTKASTSSEFPGNSRMKFESLEDYHNSWRRTRERNHKI